LIRESKVGTLEQRDYSPEVRIVVLRQRMIRTDHVAASGEREAIRH
jgi:hypothetical protein